MSIELRRLVSDAAVPRRARASDGAHKVNPNRGGTGPAAGGVEEMSNSMAVTDADFETQIEKHEGLAVVDFWATWCAPCRMIAPILDQLATEYAGKAKVAKLDVDSNIKTATRFNVRSIPTILFFKDGKLVDQVVGAVPKPTLESKFKQHAAQAPAA
jgi:thioredoxin 1